MKAEDSAAGSASTVSDLSLLRDLEACWQELSNLLHTRLRLSFLELQLAGLSLAHMLCAAILLALTLSGAWLGLMLAVALFLCEHGLSASSAVLLVVAFSLCLSLVLLGIIRRKSQYLKFPATQSSFSTAALKATSHDP